MRTKRDASGTPTWRTQNDTNESDMKEEEPRPVRPGRGERAGNPPGYVLPAYGRSMRRRSRASRGNDEMR